jgi:hypothetical protein
MHHNSNSCDSDKVLMKINNVIDYASKTKKFFPKKLKVIRIYDESEARDNLNQNGGFNDPRDQMLCLNMTTLN